MEEVGGEIVIYQENTYCFRGGGGGGETGKARRKRLRALGEEHATGGVCELLCRRDGRSDFAGGMTRGYGLALG